MGTHPIFESDFDCLTEWTRNRKKIAENASAAAIFSFITFLTCSGLFYHFQNLTPMIFYYGGFLLIASFLSFFILEGFFAIFVRSIFISVLFSFQYFVPYPLNWFIISVSLFHLGEFIATAISNPENLRKSSFLLNHSPAYHIAMSVACLEFYAEYYFFGNDIYKPWIHIVGLVGAFTGDIMRKFSMVWCGVGFSHLITFRKKKGHELVTNGPYAFCRHPSYFGWALWSISTQICLCNPICTVIFALSSYKFFEERIPLEENTLHCIFGQKYEEYRKAVPFSGIPFIDGSRS